MTSNVRPLRELVPDSLWFVTTRTVEGRLFLLPIHEVNQIVGFHLARALRKFPAIELIALIGLSNHLHLALRDGGSQLSAFCQYLFGNIAVDINSLLGRSGPLFPRPFSAERILDLEALADRIRYTVLNPAAARLVDRYEDWPGILITPWIFSS
ncbi:MAG: hypothetical protein HYV07_26670, partial [Deltaproteobacteria bacterium]|nr:hypothetical protein [Deltaproteobacteria bacterium]